MCQSTWGLKSPARMRGANQKPLTIKPYPMKIHTKYKYYFDLKNFSDNFLTLSNRIFTVWIKKAFNCSPAIFIFLTSEDFISTAETCHSDAIIIPRIKYSVVSRSKLFVCCSALHKARRHTYNSAPYSKNSSITLSP